MAKRGGLGTNLDALIPLTVNTNDVTEVVGAQDEIDINLIDPNPRQPRTVFDEEALQELVASIKEIGILQPPVVRKNGARYELIMGERRFRASKIAGLKRIPVIIRQTPNNELLREALIENIHRSQLNALEEGAAYSQLLNDFNCTQDELAKKLGRSRTVITNMKTYLAGCEPCSSDQICVFPPTRRVTRKEFEEEDWRAWIVRRENKKKSSRG